MMDERLKDELRRICQGNIWFDEPMARHTSIGVGGTADALIYPTGTEDIRGLCKLLVSRDISILPLGDGTNLLVPDAGWRGAVLCLTKGFRAISFDREIASAQAGASLSVLSRRCQRTGLGGMEFACSIPGTVGGAIRGNAGAWGGETFDRILSIDALEMNTGDSIQMKKSDLKYGYRSFDLPPGHLILSGTFEYKPDVPGEIEARMEEILSRRKTTQPLYERNAGCIFKNPLGKSAGRLIDMAGCKGVSQGGAAVSDLHANFMVNRGEATAEDVLILIDRVRDRVRMHAGVELETEIRVVGVSP